MAKKKVDKLEFKSVNGIWFPQPLKLDVFYDEGSFFIYLPEYLHGITAPEHTHTRYEGQGMLNRKPVRVLKSDAPGKIDTLMWKYLDLYFSETVKEEKIITYRFKFNSRKTYEYHKDNISFEGAPAMALKWSIYYLITFPDGRQQVLSAPYKSFGNICSSKTSDPLEKFNANNKWIFWTEERELFFANTDNAMEALIAKVHGFFNQDPTLLANAVDNSVKLIG